MNSLGVPWESNGQDSSFHLQESQIPWLVWKLRPHKPSGAAKKKKKKERESLLQNNEFPATGGIQAKYESIRNAVEMKQTKLVDQFLG